MWIKERESGHNLHVVRMGVASTVTAMERAMEAGHSVLVENMGENIDAVLNPVITRSTFKKVPFPTVFVLCKESCFDFGMLLNKPGKLTEPIWHRQSVNKLTLCELSDAIHVKSGSNSNPDWYRDVACMSSLETRMWSTTRTSN